METDGNRSASPRVNRPLDERARRRIGEIAAVFLSTARLRVGERWAAADEPEALASLLEPGAEVRIECGGPFAHAASVCLAAYLSDADPTAPNTVERTAPVALSLGIHTRPACHIAGLAMLFQADVRLACKGHEVDGRSVLWLHALGAVRGDEVRVVATGPDAAEAAAVIAGYVGGVLDA